MRWDRSIREYFSNVDSRRFFVEMVLAALGIIISLLAAPWPYGTSFTALGIGIAVVIAGSLTVRYIHKASQVQRLEEELEHKGAALAQLEQELGTLRDKHEHLLLSQSRHISDEIATFHTMVHNFRDTMFGKYRSNSRADFQVPATEQQLEVFKEICDVITSQTKAAIRSRFRLKQIELGDDLSVTVKLVLSGRQLADYYASRLPLEQRNRLRAKDRWIVTVYRDPETYAKRPRVREVGEYIYDIELNTAFREILIGHERFFACDDLQSREANRYYTNENKNWKLHYNATLIAPIRYHEQDSTSPFYFGLLSVDCLNKNRDRLFEHDADCLNLMAHAADLLATFFLTLSLYQYYELFTEGE